MVRKHMTKQIADYCLTFFSILWGLMKIIPLFL